MTRSRRSRCAPDAFMLVKLSALREGCPLLDTWLLHNEKGSPAGSLFLNCQLQTERDPRSQKHSVEGLVTALRPHGRSSYEYAGAVTLIPPDPVGAAVTRTWHLYFSDLGSRSVEIPPVYPTDGSC